jgi:hypothetical protein
MAGVTIRHSYRFSQRFRSWRNACSLGIANRLRWSRGIYREQPCDALQNLDAASRGRIKELSARYRIRFEAQASQTTSLNNYEYLDLLDAGIARAGVAVPSRATVHDVGSASFWYAAALSAFFKPERLLGFETEGHRRYLNGHTRRDYASGYTQGIAASSYRIQDYRSCNEPAGIITAWYPFVTAEPLLAWGLRLQDLDPAGLLDRVCRNLVAGGLFFMVNHGEQEADLASAWCHSAGLRAENRHIYRPWIKVRALAPVATCWRYSGTSCILRRGS